MFPPPPKIKHQAAKVHTLGLCAKVLQFCAAFFQKRLKPCGIAVRIVVKCGSHLDETVQEKLTSASSLQPHGFESFMCLEISPIIK